LRSARLIALGGMCTIALACSMVIGRAIADQGNDDLLDRAKFELQVLTDYKKTVIPDVWQSPRPSTACTSFSPSENPYAANGGDVARARSSAFMQYGFLRIPNDAEADFAAISVDTERPILLRVKPVTPFQVIVPYLSPGQHHILVTMLALKPGGGMRQVSETPTCVIIPALEASAAPRGQ
jgi:hypothetical protein